MGGRTFIEHTGSCQNPTKPELNLKQGYSILIENLAWVTNASVTVVKTRSMGPLIYDVSHFGGKEVSQSVTFC